MGITKRPLTLTSISDYTWRIKVLWGHEDSKNQMIREFVVRFCLVLISEATPIKVTNMTV